jgi:hypothetical protein
MVNVLVSGKLGDLIHSLYVCEHLYRTRGKKSHVFMTDKVEYFENGLYSTYQELHKVLLSQKWLGNFSIYQGENIDYDTTTFRQSPLLYNSCWSDIMLNTFFPNEEYCGGGWIKLDVGVEEDLIVVNRRFKNDMPTDVLNAYTEITNQFSKRFFLGSMDDYERFPLKKNFIHIIPKSILEWFNYISRSEVFIGNQSSPLAMASALDVPRFAELLPTIDKAHYIGEEKYSNYIQLIN